MSEKKGSEGQNKKFEKVAKIVNERKPGIEGVSPEAKRKIIERVVASQKEILKELQLRDDDIEVKKETFRLLNQSVVSPLLNMLGAVVRVDMDLDFTDNSAADADPNDPVIFYDWDPTDSTTRVDADPTDSAVFVSTDL